MYQYQFNVIQSKYFKMCTLTFLFKFYNFPFIFYKSTYQLCHNEKRDKFFLFLFIS